MTRDPRPENETPVLFCQGQTKECKDTPCKHRFSKAEPVGAGLDGTPSHYRLIFAADCCGHERVFGLLDPRQSGRGSGP